MIVEVAIGSALVALGVVALRALRRRREELEDEAARAVEEAQQAKAKSAPPSSSSGPASKGRGKDDAPAKRPEPVAAPRRSGPRGLQIGDVLLYAQSEYWLAGEVYLDEEGFVLTLFPSPGTTRASFVAQLDIEAKEVAFLKETSEVPDGSIPTELPVDGVRLSVHKRGQARVRTAGEHLPETSKRASYVWMKGPGDRTLIVIEFEGKERLSLVGDRVSKGLYDLLPGGDV